MTEKTVEHECGKVYWGTNSPHFCPHCNSSMTRAIDTDAEAAQRVIDAQAEELDKLITLHLRCVGENNRLRAEIAELREGKPGSEPPVVGDGLRSSTLKLLLCLDNGWYLGHYVPARGWVEMWGALPLSDVVTWWELPMGGTK